MTTTTISDFEILKLLGEGSFGFVYQVKRRDTQKIYAMKKVKMIALTNKEKENALNEVRILASINSPNVVSYKEAFYDENSSSLCLIMDYATNGDLLMKIADLRKRKMYLKEEIIWKYAADMILGLKALHDKKILHRDFKSANVFIAEDNSLKLGDMNVSKVQKTDFARTQTGTPFYTSPEVWQKQPYDSKCDIWSLGCVLYELITLEPPFLGKSMDEVYKRVVSGSFNPISMKIYSQHLQKFLEVCLRADPKSRPNVDMLLKHKYIMQHVNFDVILEKDRKIDSDQRKSAKTLPSNIHGSQELLRTIRLPQGGLQGLRGLNRNLPKPNYGNNQSTEQEEESLLMNEYKADFFSNPPQQQQLQSQQQKGKSSQEQAVSGRTNQQDSGVQSLATPMYSQQKQHSNNARNRQSLQSETESKSMPELELDFRQKKQMNQVGAGPVASAGSDVGQQYSIQSNKLYMPLIVSPNKNQRNINASSNSINLKQIQQGSSSSSNSSSSNNTPMHKKGSGEIPVLKRQGELVESRKSNWNQHLPSPVQILLLQARQSSDLTPLQSPRMQKSTSVQQVLPPLSLRRYY